jgi:hypothetical protein
MKKFSTKTKLASAAAAGAMAVAGAGVAFAYWTTGGTGDGTGTVGSSTSNLTVDASVATALIPGGDSEPVALSVDNSSRPTPTSALRGSR